METETNLLPQFIASQQKVDRLLSLNKITLNDMADLEQRERRYFSERLTENLRELTGADRDEFLDKIALVITPATKSELWEYNHFTISAAIADYMHQHGIMPTRNHIAKKTGLTRQTVSKHFREYQAHPDFKETLEQFKFMNPKMLASVFACGLDGDMRAARLYFEMTGALNRKHSGTVVNGQTNYIQINNTILNQEKLQQLTPAQLNQIEQIITKG